MTGPLLAGPLGVRIQLAPSAVYVIYIDESGTHTSARHFVVAGLAVFERDTYHLAQRVDELVERRIPQGIPPLPLHASALRAPPERQQPPFDAFTRSERRELISDVYRVIATSRVRVFAVVMEKEAVDGHPYDRGFEEIVNRFDMMLSRINQEEDEKQRGLVVIAESSYRENLERLAQQIWAQGHRWGETHNIADIPYFAPAGNTRLLQLADFIANAVYGRYESGYTRDFDIVAQRFDQDDGRIHGLVHIGRDKHLCYCPACVAHRAAPRPEAD